MNGGTTGLEPAASAVSCVNRFYNNLQDTRDCKRRASPIRQAKLWVGDFSGNCPVRCLSHVM